MKKEFFYTKKDEKEFFKNYILEKNHIEVKDIICENVFFELVCLDKDNQVFLYSMQYNSVEYLSDSLEEFMELLNDLKPTNKIYREYIFASQWIEKNFYSIEEFDKDTRFIFKEERASGYFDKEVVEKVSRKKFLQKFKT